MSGSSTEDARLVGPEAQEGEPNASPDGSTEQAREPAPVEPKKARGILARATAALAALTTFLGALALVINYWDGLIEALEDSQLIEWVREILPIPCDEISVTAEHFEEIPYSLEKTIISWNEERGGRSNQLYWLLIKAKNDCNKKISLEVTVDVYPRRNPYSSDNLDSLGQRQTYFSDTIEGTVEPNKEAKFSVYADKTKSEPLSRKRKQTVEIDWKAYAHDTDRAEDKSQLKEGKIFIQFTAENIFPWDWAEPNFEDFDDFIMATLAAWVMDSSRSVREFRAKIHKEMRPLAFDDQKDFADEWMRRAYNRLFSKENERQYHLNVFKKLSHDFPGRRAIKLPGEMLAATMEAPVSIDPLEGAVVLAAVSYQALAEKGVRLALLTTDSEDPDGKQQKKVYLGWWHAGHRVYSAVDLSLTGETFEDNVERASEDFNRVFRISGGLRARLNRQNGVFRGDDSTSAIEFSTAARHFSIVGIR